MFDVILCGAGKMGRHHLRVTREHPAFRVVAIVDPALAGGTIDGVPVVASASEVRARYSVAIVATPIATHEQLALELLERGVDLLIEKPLAATPASCERIRAVAAARGARVAVAHVERFNPAVHAIAATLPTLGAVTSVAFTRRGGGRGDALLDLAVHDLDLVELLFGRATLRSANVLETDGDLVHAAIVQLVTARGVHVTIAVASNASERTRAVRVSGEHASLEADLLTLRCRRIANGHDSDVAVDDVEPLRAQLSAFAAYLDGAKSDVASLTDGARVVGLAAEARASGRGRSVVVEEAW